MIRYLLDTMVVSAPSKSKPDPAVMAWLASVDDAELAISAVTVRELAYGAQRAMLHGHRSAAAIAAGVEAVIAAYADRVLPLDPPAAMTWGHMLAEKNKHIEDTAQAAIAHANGLTLVTRNISHVLGRGVPLLDPFMSPAKIYP